MNKEEKQITTSLALVASLCRHCGIPFVMGVDFGDGDGDKFWSSLGGTPKKREWLLGNLAGISADMESNENEKGTPL